MRIDKFKMSNLANGLMIQHNQRTEKTAETRKFSNELIDKTRTHLNYSLSENRGLSYLKEQLNSIYHIKRDDIVVCASCCVFLPKDFNGTEKEFFQTMKQFLDKEFGERFCVSANVHLDETTPHLHYMFIPAVKNEKYHTSGASKDYEYRLNAKKLLNRQYFQDLHQRAEKYMRERLPGRTINLLTGATHDRDYLQMDAYKAQRERERIQSIEKENAERERAVKAKEIELAERERTIRVKTGIRASEPAEPEFSPDLYAKKGFLIKKPDSRYVKTEVYKKAVKDKNEALIERNTAQEDEKSKDFLLKQAQRSNAELKIQVRDLEHKLEIAEKRADRAELMNKSIIEVLPDVIKSRVRGMPEQIKQLVQEIEKKAQGRAKKRADKQQERQKDQTKQKEHNKRLQAQIEQAERQQRQRTPKSRTNHQFNSPSR